MVIIPDVRWAGLSGATYGYFSHPIGSDYYDLPGNYIFTKRVEAGWIPIYIGESDNLGVRLSNHEKLGAAIRLGATHIHAHTNNIELARWAEERDLIRNWNPPLNKEYSLLKRRIYS